MNTRLLRGFTLIEMMVAVGLFVVVALITTTALVAMSNASRQFEDSKFLMENVGLALDSISYKAQQIRSSTKYYCGAVSSYNISIGLTCDSGDALIFRFDRGAGTFTDYLYQLSSDGYIGYNSQDDAIVPLTPLKRLTAPNVNITKLQFYVRNPPNAKSRVTVYIEGEVRGKNGTKTLFRIQRTISQQT